MKVKKKDGNGMIAPMTTECSHVALMRGGWQLQKLDLVIYTIYVGQGRQHHQA